MRAGNLIGTIGMKPSIIHGLICGTMLVRVLGFSSYDYFYDDTSSIVGARLVFKTRALAEFAGKTFTDVYRGFMVIEK